MMLFYVRSERIRNNYCLIPWELLPNITSLHNLYKRRFDSHMMNHKSIFNFIVVIVLSLLMLPLIGQQQFGGAPLSQEQGIDITDSSLGSLPLKNEVVQLKSKDTEGTNVHALSLISTANQKSLSPQFSQPAPNVVLTTVDLPESTYSYLRLDEYNLPKGARLFIIEHGSGEVHGSYTAGNNSKTQRLLLGPFSGSYTVEYNYANADQDNVPFRIAQVYAMTGDQAANDLGFGTAFNCSININCDEGRSLQEASNGVVRIRVVGEEAIALCTGSLMNNTTEDQTPYILAAYHCTRPAGVEFTPLFDQWIFDFLYQSNSCANPNDEPSFSSVQGSELIAEWEDTDMLLVRLTSPIPLVASAYFNGWDRTPDYLPAATHLIHHPNGDIKKVAQDFDSLRLDLNPRQWDNGTITPTRSHYRAEFDNSTYQPGSSGGPLLDNNQRVIGQLHGGPRSDEFCTIAIAYSGRLSESWIGGGTPETRLSDWLDPLDNGVLQLDGITSDAQEQFVQFTGRVITPDGIAISNVGVTLSGEQDFEFFTGSDGRFVFNNLSSRGTFNFALDKDVNASNGLSGLDIVLITNHVLGRVPFSTVFQQLAGDVSGDGRVSSIDLVQMTNVLLGRTDTFPNSPSWRFEPESLQMSGSEISNNSVELVVVGFKVGDVNNSADPRR